MKVLTLREVAEALHLAPATIYRLVGQGKFPKPVRLGRSVRFRLDELQAWADAGCPPISQWKWPTAGRGVAHAD